MNNSLLLDILLKILGLTLVYSAMYSRSTGELVDPRDSFLVLAVFSASLTNILCTFGAIGKISKWLIAVMIFLMLLAPITLMGGFMAMGGPWGTTLSDNIGKVALLVPSISLIWVVVFYRRSND